MRAKKTSETYEIQTLELEYVLEPGTSNNAATLRYEGKSIPFTRAELEELRDLLVELLPP